VHRESGDTYGESKSLVEVTSGNGRMRSQPHYMEMHTAYGVFSPGETGIRLTTGGIRFTTGRYS